MTFAFAIGSPLTIVPRLSGVQGWTHLPSNEEIKSARGAKRPPPPPPPPPPEKKTPGGGGIMRQPYAQSLPSSWAPLQLSLWRLSVFYLLRPEPLSYRVRLMHTARI